MTFDLFSISRSLVVPSVEHLNMNKTIKLNYHTHNISYNLFSFHGSIQDCKIHVDMEIVIFA